MTERRHAVDDVDVPGLEDVHVDADPADLERTDELLEGLLGADAVERDDIPLSESNSNETDAGAGNDDRVVETATGHRVCRFCEAERRSPDGVETHQATCRDSQHYQGIR